MNKNTHTLDFATELKRKNIKRPFSIMVKVCGSRCNMDCDYCYYIEKDLLYAGRKLQMREDTLEHLIKTHIEAQPHNNVEFVWHGGEPTLAGLDYFRNIVALQKKHKGSKQISNVLQTNGTTIDEEWCVFLREHNFLCGISIDGPKYLHDKHRRFNNRKGSWEKIMETIKLFHKYQVEFNTMTTVNNTNAKHPEAIYNFLKSIGSKYMQFIPIVERIAEDENETMSIVSAAYQNSSLPMLENVSGKEWGKFLIKIFDLWIQNDVGKYFVNIFDATLASHMKYRTGLCTMNQYCTCAPAIEHNGDSYCCDHFVFPEFLTGNIIKHHIEDLVKIDQQLLFEEDKWKKLSEKCLTCEFLTNCYGDCPKNRIAKTEKGQNISALCEGLYNFFSHTQPYFLRMAEELKLSAT